MMTNDLHAALTDLRDGRLYRFADWPNPAVPNGRIGAFTVWQDDQLVYVRMADRAISPAAAASEVVALAEDQVRGKIAGRPRREESGCLGTEFVEQVAELCSLNGVEERTGHIGGV